MTPTIAYDTIKKEYVPVFTGKGCYQIARKQGIRMTYCLDLPGQPEINDNDICTVNGTDVVIRGWIWINKTDLGLFLGADPDSGILLYPEKEAIEKHFCDLILPAYKDSMVIKKKFKYEVSAVVVAELEAVR